MPEKLVAGFYLGQIFCYVFLDMHHNRGVIFSEQDVSHLREPYVMKSFVVALILISLWCGW